MKTSIKGQVLVNEEEHGTPVLDVEITEEMLLGFLVEVAKDAGYKPKAERLSKMKNHEGYFPMLTEINTKGNSC